MNAREIERLLQPKPVAPPPAELAERIKAEIPDTLELAPELALKRPRPRFRQWWYAAAAVLTLAITTTLGWQLRHQRPADRLAQRVEQRDAAVPPPAPVTVDSGATGDRSPAAPETTSTQPGPAAEPAADAASRAPATPVPVADAARQPGSVTGTVIAQDGASLPGVVVTLTDPTTGLQRTAVTDARGEYRVSQLPAGRYEVDATLDGFVGAGGELDVAAEGEKRADMEMRLGQFDGNIEVTSTAPAVDVTSTNTGMIVEAPASGPRSHGADDAKKQRLNEARLGSGQAVPPSTGGTTEPNDQPYGDVFFSGTGVNPFVDTDDDHLSTFGLEVDTGSYTVARRYLRDGYLPPHEAVRVEELVNAFSYGDPPPRRGDFALVAEGAPSPFTENQRYRVLRFAVTARAVDRDQRPPAVLTFVVDVSGSMDRENRLGLVKQALSALLDNLRADDRVGLVVYGSSGQVLLEPSSDHEAIRAAIGRLVAGGSTNAEEGLVLAFGLASRYLDAERINRVILCSDGVANVGRTGPDGILERIRADAERGIELTTVGFGMGNYNDVLMEQLADAGDGRYAYVDALPEARRLFVEELTGTLLTIGHEARAQVDFNPAVVARYRLLGYENRDIPDERFRDDTVDAGEIGAGHTVTALYEVKLQPGARRRDTVATLHLRYRPVGRDELVEDERALTVRELADSWQEASPALRLAAVVAEYAEILKGSYWARQGSMDRVLREAQQLSPDFAGDARVADLVALAATAAELLEPTPTPVPRWTDGE